MHGSAADNAEHKSEASPRVCACSQAKEVQININTNGLRHGRGPNVSTTRILSGIMAQRHWIWLCTEGLLGIHLLRELWAAASEAVHMTGRQWLTVYRYTLLV